MKGNQNLSLCKYSNCLWFTNMFRSADERRETRDERRKFRLTNNLISDFLFLHTASLKSRCFLFIFIILVFILDFRLVRKLVFLYFNVNVYLKEIPCLNEVTLPYLTLPHGFIILISAIKHYMTKPSLLAKGYFPW